MAEMKQRNEDRLHALKQENKDMKRKLYGERSTPSTHRVDRTKVVTHSSRSQVNKNNNTEEEESPFSDSGYNPSFEEWCHPFVDSILDPGLLARWKGLGMDRYDGSADPDKHIDTYETQMRLYTTDQAVICRVFPTSLKGMTFSLPVSPISLSTPLRPWWDYLAPNFPPTNCII